jgi:hemolysin-activating ACP:hemolysin acyltransferase
MTQAIPVAANGKSKPSRGKTKAEAPMSEQATSPTSPAVRHPREARQARFAQSFSQIVAVMMRDPKFRQLRLAELEWLVLPPLIAGQWRLAQTKVEQMMAKPGETAPQTSMVVPVGAAIWARVSPEIDKRLSENLDKPIALKPNEWVSGNQIWLIAAMGDPRAIPTFLKSLQETEFKDQAVKLRAPGPNETVVISNLTDYVASLPKPAAPTAPAQQA